MSDIANNGKTKSIATRVDKETEGRLNLVAKLSRRKKAAVLLICLEDHLPVLETELGIKPGGGGQAPKKKRPI